MKTAAAVPTVVDVEQIQATRTQYAELFELQAEWREQKAAEFPDDRRNAQSAAGLREIAKWMMTLTTNHPLLRRLAAAFARAEEANFADTEKENRLISRFRFGTEEKFEEFIEALIENMTVVDPLEEKRRESRLRRALARDGYVLRKSRARNWRLDNQQGYMILDPSMNISVSHSDYSLDLDDVERWLKG